VFYWFLKLFVLGPALRTLFRPWVRGLDNVPETGGAIFASNHLSFSDSIFLPLVVPRRITFLAKADYFTGRGVKGRLTAGFFKGVGQLPIDRTGGQRSDGAIRTGLRVLNRGDLLGLYPEGTRSPDGRLYRGKTGVARIALEAHCPVVPVVMVGTDQVQPIGRKIPHIRRVGVVIGAPLDFSRYEGMENDRFVLRSITDEIMYELMRLSGQEYVDVYAADMKDQLAAAKRSKVAEPTASAPGGRTVPEPVPDAVPDGPAATPAGAVDGDDPTGDGGLTGDVDLTADVGVSDDAGVTGDLGVADDRDPTGHGGVAGAGDLTGHVEVPGDLARHDVRPGESGGDRAAS